MPLKKTTGNMYEFVTHTWNPIKGKCKWGCKTVTEDGGTQCSYCYADRFGKRGNPRLDEKELKTDLGTGNYIFVCSGTDMFGPWIPYEWKSKVLEYCSKYENKYLLHTKNPKGLLSLIRWFPEKTMLCCTIETNRVYEKIMKDSPSSEDRVLWFTDDFLRRFNKMVTIEPVMDFDLKPFVRMIDEVKPFQINIGADSGHNNLPEPDPDKLHAFIAVLHGMGYNVHLKKNIKRLFTKG